MILYNEIQSGESHPLEYKLALPQNSHKWIKTAVTCAQGAGIVAFITNGSWLDGNAQDGLRKCFADEFTSIYILNLRGNCRTSGELRRKEGDGVFGLGSRTPISITILVKKPQGREEK